MMMCSDHRQGYRTSTTRRKRTKSPLFDPESRRGNTAGCPEYSLLSVECPLAPIAAATGPDHALLAAAATRGSARSSAAAAAALTVVCA